MQCSFYTTPSPAVKVCGETVSLTVGRFLNHHALSVLTFPKSSKLLQKQRECACGVCRRVCEREWRVLQYAEALASV